jgi:hypothetical protein
VRNRSYQFLANENQGEKHVEERQCLQLNTSCNSQCHNETLKQLPLDILMTRECMIESIFPHLRACLNCFGNGNEKADSEGSPRSLQKIWIVKLILAQFSLICDALLTRLQKLETRFLQRTRKSDTSVFASFLGVSILFRNASSARKSWLYRVQSTETKNRLGRSTEGFASMFLLGSEFVLLFLGVLFKK